MTLPEIANRLRQISASIDEVFDEDEDRHLGLEYVQTAIDELEDEVRRD